MSDNAVLSLNLCYEDWHKTRLVNGKAPHGLQPFEYFCTEQFLKRFLLNDDEIVFGMVGDANDGGIDAFHFFINRVLADDNTPVDRRSENDVDVIIMQIKENKGFSPTAIEKMERFTDDLFDLRRTPDKYRYKYHPRLMRLMHMFKQKMKSMGKANLTVEYYYITRCIEPPDDNAVRAARSLKEKALSHFQKADIKPFNFAGAQRLYDQTNVRPPAKKYLIFVKSFDSPEGWVGLVPLKTFYEFLKDPDAGNQLNESIFDDNVRGYYLNTSVNRAITITLTNPQNEPEFWMLNNGITILTPYAALNSGVLEIRAL